MTKMTSREQFEDAYSLYMGVIIETIRDCRRESGYSDSRMEVAWRMWQASRAAIEIELPTSFEGPYMTLVMYTDEVENAIECEGLKVKK